jgi:hypothetical protein
MGADPAHGTRTKIRYSQYESVVFSCRCACLLNDIKTTCNANILCGLLQRPIHRAAPLFQLAEDFSCITVLRFVDLFWL